VVAARTQAKLADRRAAYEMSVTERRIKIIGPECLGFQARLLSRVVTAVYDDAFAEIGLKVSQFSVLNTIAIREEMRPAELAKLLEMDESTLSRNVARMCARGWLRLEHGADGCLPATRCKLAIFCREFGICREFGSIARQKIHIFAAVNDGPPVAG